MWQYHNRVRDGLRSLRRAILFQFLRIEDGLAAEHWDAADYIRLYQAFGLLH